jgi:uncharacterized membrane protein
VCLPGKIGAPLASESAFFSPRVLLAAVVSSAAAFSVVSGALLAFFRPEAPAKASHPAGAGLTFAERVSYQRAIEEVYWRHRIWPRNRGERPDPKPSLDAVMLQSQALTGRISRIRWLRNRRRMNM